MSPYNQPFPLPYFQINKEGVILAYSDAAANLFHINQGNILALVDKASEEKVKTFIFKRENPQKIEANFKTKINSIQLFDIHLSWDEQSNGHMVLLVKDQLNKHLEDRLLSLQKRLSSTNFELFEKKEELERTLIRLRELSGPFIALSSGLAFIPLFGDITKEKLEAITGKALQSAYEGDYSHIVVDFTAVGQIEKEGVDKLLELFTMLRYMSGAEIEVVGMKPHHSQIMNSLQNNWSFSFSSSLAEVLQRKNK
ncbi:STAS domain-containing protein [Pseudobacillus sp. FSL P4-0506]|uniref:STAS domain-containing protein n=1 Tax=unclassified Pseudobacillus TaxID=2619284 RepID=UPI0030F5439E